MSTQVRPGTAPAGPPLGALVPAFLAPLFLRYRQFVLADRLRGAYDLPTAEWILYGGGYLALVLLLFVAVFVASRRERCGPRALAATVAAGVVVGHFAGVLLGWGIWPDAFWTVVTPTGEVPVRTLTHASLALVGRLSAVLSPLLFAAFGALAAVAVAAAADGSDPAPDVDSS